MATTKIVIRGLILPGGMPHLADITKSKYTTWFAAGFKARGIIKAFKKGKIDKHAAIVGHSLGANAAINLANDLTEAGMSVEVLALDPTYENEVLTEKAYAIQSSDFRAQQITGAENISRKDLDHMNMTRDTEVLKLAIDILNG